MSVKLRLVRMGKKKHPTYRVIAADARSPRDGRFIEVLGIYHPVTRVIEDAMPGTPSSPAKIEIDTDKAVKWLRQGAQPTERVKKLLEISGAWGQFKNGSSE